MPEKIKTIRKISDTALLPPGTLVYIGDKTTEGIKITIIDYDEKNFTETSVSKIEESFPFKDTDTITWINIDGIHNLGIIEKIGKYFNLHPLILEDIVNTGQRPKIEDYDNYIFIVLKMLYFNGDGDEIIAEHVSLVLMKNIIISFQETEGDVFNSLRERLRNAKGRLRKEGADYLAYSLIDAIVDGYFTILETIEDSVENVEDVLMINPTQETVQDIYIIKKNTAFLKKYIWPLREIVHNLERRGSSLITEITSIYLRDLYDHTIQVIDSVESFRDTMSGMMEIYISSISNKMNEVMKTLTMIATIFIPITFVAGIYGMNFNTEISGWNMPELHWKYGYFFALSIMLLIAITMTAYFKRKKWL